MIPVSMVTLHTGGIHVPGIGNLKGILYDDAYKAGHGANQYVGMKLTYSKGDGIFVSYKGQNFLVPAASCLMVLFSEDPTKL